MDLMRICQYDGKTVSGVDATRARALRHRLVSLNLVVPDVQVLRITWLYGMWTRHVIISKNEGKIVMNNELKGY